MAGKPTLLAYVVSNAKEADGTNIVCDSTTPTIASGQVGIGTTSLSQALTVAGNIDNHRHGAGLGQN